MRPLKTYACYLKDDEIRMRSSSGAVFSSLAAHVFSMHGAVYGVSMSEDCYSAEFTCATDEKDLDRLRGSKYLQAGVGNIYQEVKADLTAGRMVLFSGTSCEVNGLKSFLGKDYDHLICVDLVCHGASSPALWKTYVQYRERVNDGKMKRVNFRCKDTGWKKYGVKETVERRSDAAVKEEFIPRFTHPYIQMYFLNYCLRPCCYECVARNNRQSDLTIADFWGIDMAAPEMDDDKGTSLVLVRTEKGEKVFKALRKSIEYKEVSYEDGVKDNPREYLSVLRKAERDTFFHDMRSMSFEKLMEKYTPRLYKAQIKAETK